MKITKDIVLRDLKDGVIHAISEAKYHILREGHRTNFELLKDPKIRDRFVEYFKADMLLNGKKHVANFNAINVTSSDSVFEKFILESGNLLNSYILDNLDSLSSFNNNNYLRALKNLIDKLF